MKRILNYLAWFLFMTLLAGSPTPPTQAAPLAASTFAVNNNLTDAPDATPGNGVCETATGNGICTLRAAIMEANALTGADTITLQAGATYVLTLAGADDTAAKGDLDITDDLTLFGSSAIIDGGGNVTNDRVFEIHPDATVDMSYLTIRGGKSSQHGGGIYILGVLTLSHSAITGNFAFLSGGGLHNFGTLTLINSSVRVNSCGSCYGAGISNAYATLTLMASTISNNVVMDNGEGGGIATFGENNSSTVTIINSTISGNKGGNGGGIFIQGESNGNTVTVTNSTIRGNTASANGGGISNQNSTLNITNSTISSNQADLDGGGIYNYDSSITNLRNVTLAYNFADMNNDAVGSGGGIVNTGPGSAVNLRNSLIANNVLENGILDSLNDCDGPLNSEGYNLIRITTNCSIAGNLMGNQTGVDPQLASALALHGGPTRMHALLTGSPAIDAGNPNGCADGLGALLPIDQRSYARHINGGSGQTRCDMGAYEYESILIKQDQTIIFNPLPDRTLGEPPFTISATTSSGLPVSFSSSTPAACMIGSNTVTLLSEGICTIMAAQPGNDYYNPAPNMSRNFTIHNLGQAPGSYRVFLPVLVK